MKHAVLITAHRSPQLLAELVDTMTTARSSVFIHIDRRASFGPDELRAMLHAPEAATMIEPRSPVHWRGYSYLAVVLRMARTALGQGPFDFVHLLSGQCFPTRAADEIFDAFEADPRREYMECFELPSERWEGGGISRMRYHHPYDRLDARRRLLGVPFNQGIIYGLVGAQRLFGLRRDLPGRFPTYYGGSVFWSLTGPCVEHVIAYLDGHPEVEEGFRDTYCPEEILFPTVIANSPFAARISGSGRRYIDWTYRNGSEPAVLDDSDFDAIVDSGALFARKVDPEISAGLLDRLRRLAGTGKSSGPP